VSFKKYITNITNVGELSLLYAVRNNTSIIKLTLKCGDNIIQSEIESIIGWNKIGGLVRGEDIKKFPLQCKGRIQYLLLLIKELPICDDIYWNIMSMLKVKDIVKSGNPMQMHTWT